MGAPATPSSTYSSELRLPRRPPSEAPMSTTENVCPVRGTGVNGSEMASCADAAISPAPAAMSSASASTPARGSTASRSVVASVVAIFEPLLVAAAEAFVAVAAKVTSFGAARPRASLPAGAGVAVREHHDVAGRGLQPRGRHVLARLLVERPAQDLALVRPGDDEQDVARREHRSQAAPQCVGR